MKFIETKYRRVAVTQLPGAAKIVKVDGGYMGFATIGEWKTWKKQS